MDQNTYAPEEFDLVLAEIKEHQRRDVLLCIDEIMVSLDAGSQAEAYWKSARRHVQLIQGYRFATQAGIPV